MFDGTTIVLTESSMIEALQYYFEQVVFKNAGFAVTAVHPDLTKGTQRRLFTVSLMKADPRCEENQEG